MRKEFITIVSRLLFQSGKGPSLAAGSRKAFPLFEEAANRCIRPAAKVKREGMALFELAGLLMAKALLEGDVLETSLSRYCAVFLSGLLALLLIHRFLPVSYSNGCSVGR